ncbi:DUF58 domain-containing protein [Halobacillus aidingensis]|uniref:Uncharacterized conserved protein, DUF58 family, contains vWF domain n=1 Tax=Halobacillus aidingensis TaxID=240303 RepID=A0A1H0EAS8_HALAD|nr:DUF58 domain-containing protein [Halobacillus aidingensis]SDN79406.1 Uncharacterized conserved protein, DUF58 family, contains vWF domain [Halobacillus aidingensis]
MAKSFKNLWDQFLFRDKGIVPTKRLLLFILALSFVLILLSWIGLSWPFIIAANGAILLLSLIDLTFSPKRKELQIRRAMDEEMERGIENEASVLVRNASDKRLAMKVIDHFPQSFSQPFPLKKEIQGYEEARITYLFHAEQRGDYTLPHLHVRYRSRFGLWEKQMRVEQTDSVRIIPDLTESRNFLEDAQRFLLYEGTRLKRRQVGTGEFSKIRSYVVGDDIRKINWRQTAKVQNLMTNEYEPEHGKFVTLLIDCGRMMGVELEENNRLEKSLEAAMTLATAALKRGDYVAVLAFSKHVHVYVPPAKGMAHMQTILKEIYNLKVEGFESNYTAVFQHLQKVQSRRSLLLLFSDVSTFLYEEAALHYLQRLRRSHLFLMIGIEDRVIDSQTRREPEDLQTTLVKTMAQKHVLDKKQELKKWERQGLQMIEAPEEELATSTVSHYINIMNRGLL